MKRISNTIIKRFAALNYEYPQNKILAGFDANNIYANDLIINKSSKLEKPHKETFFSFSNSSNTLPYKNYFITDFPCNYSPRSNIEAEDNARNYTAGRLEKTPLWKNTSYMNVLDRNLREKSGTLYAFQDSANVNHFVQINYNEPSSSSSYSYSINISLIQAEGLSNIQNSVVRNYPTSIISAFTNNYIYNGTPSIFWVDTTRKYIYLNMYAGYIPSATIATYRYQTRLLYRISYTTTADGGSLSLSDYQYIFTPGTNFYIMSYMHADQLFFCGFGNNGNPVYIRAIEKNADDTMYGWYQTSPYTDTHYHRYIIFEHKLATDEIALLQDLDSTTAWGLGASSVNSSVNRIVGHCSPSSFQHISGDDYIAFFPGFNTNNQLTPVSIKWNKATNVFQVKLLPTNIQSTIKNEYQDVHEDATPYVPTFSNTTFNLSLKVVSPVVMEIVTGELGNKYLTVYNDLYNNRMRAYCTSTGVRNMVTFQISNDWETLTHVQTTELDALFTLPLNQDRTKLASAESTNASLWSFSEVNYWQKVSTTPAICYFLVKKDDSSFYAVTLNNDTLSSQSITEYPERRYITSEILEISANQAELTININTGDSVSYNGSPLNKSIFVDALSNGQRVIQDVTLTIDSDQAVFAGPPEANMITITTSDTESTEVPLILNFPGAIIISAKFTDLEV